MRRPGFPWRVLALGALLVGLAAARPTGVRAATLTVNICDKSHLDAALAAANPGDTIAFQCSGTIHDNITIGQDLTLDATGQTVTLNGSFAGTVITVNSGVLLAVTGLNVVNGEPSGIVNNGTVTLTNSTVDSNLTLGEDGGGIFNSGVATLTNSTVSNNSTLNDGGGIFNRLSATLTLINSTVSSNVTGNGGLGGGIFNDGTAILTNSTISDNDAYDGGGINNLIGTVTLRNTILAGNSAFTSGPDCDHTLTSADYNLIQNTTSCAIGGTTTHNITGQSPDLGPLQDNGGLTQTQALLAGSPAIDVVPQANLVGLTTDQRGVPRPDNGETTGDIGAYEFNEDTALGLANVPANITTNATSPAGAVVTYTLPTAVDEAGDSPAATVGCALASGSTFPIGTTTVTCTATSGDDTPRTVSATFTVTVNDTDLGQPTVPANITTPATSASGAVVSWPAQTASDEPGETPTVTCQSGTGLTSGSTFPVGQTTVTCTATDGDDTNIPPTNSFTVTVNDADLGQPIVPANITTPATSASGAVVSWPAQTASDEPGETPTVTCQSGTGLTSGSTFPVGQTTVTCTATDGDDTNIPPTNSFTVTVNDADLGQPIVPANITTPATSASGAVVSWPAQTASDEPGETPTVTCQSGSGLTSGSTFPVGQTTVTCTATSGDDTPSTVSQSFTVTVKPVLTASGTSVSATEGSLFSGVVATGTAYGTSNPLTASIAWGDGSTSTVSVTPGVNGSFSVSASHQYAEEGQNTTTVTITDGSGLQVVTTGTATVSDAALSLRLFAAGPVDEPTAGLAATFTDADPAGQVSDYQAAINWGDGPASTVKVVKNPFGKGFGLADQHRYAEKGTYTVTLTVTDHGGSQLTKTVRVTVTSGREGE